MKKKLVITALLIVSLITNAQVANWSFSENADDLSGNGNHGILLPDEATGPQLTTDKAGIENEAYIFDGTDNGIELTDKEALELTEFTVFARVKFNSVTNAVTIFSTFHYEAANKYWGYTFRVNNGNIQFYNVRGGVNGANNIITSNATINVGQYYDLSVTYNGTTAKLYIDGVFDSEKAIPVPLFHATNKRAYIGCTDGLGGIRRSFFSGTIDEVEVYNTALSLEDIQELPNDNPVATTCLFKKTGSDIYYEGGNVGIGTTTPTQKLEIKGNLITSLDNNMSNILVTGHGGGNADRPTMQILRSRGVNSSRTALQTNDAVGAYFFGGHDGTTYQYGSALYSYVDGTVTSGSVPTRLSFVTGSNSSTRNEKMVIKSNGNIGIGTTTPESKLVVEDGMQRIRFLTGTCTSNYTLDIGINNDGVNFTNNSSIRGFNFSNANGLLMEISATGNVAIHKNLEVKKLKVTTTPTADFVFAPDYNLRSLEEVDAFVNENHHLPEIASAEEMEKNGLDMAEFQIQLLQKVEELTLYIIGQQKTIDAMARRMAELEE